MERGGYAHLVVCWRRHDCGDCGILCVHGVPLGLGIEAVTVLFCPSVRVCCFEHAVRRVRCSLFCVFGVGGRALLSGLDVWGTCGAFLFLL